jgi:hypothetical protein
VSEQPLNTSPKTQAPRQLVDSETGEVQHFLRTSRVADSPSEYINVWDACGQLGYLIPWARWKAQSPTIYDSGHHRRFVDTKFINLLARESVTGGAFNHNKFPIVFLEDYKGGPDGIEWENVRLAIIAAARAAGCVIQAVPVPPIEVVQAELQKSLVANKRLSDRIDDLVAECDRHKVGIEVLRADLQARISKPQSKPRKPRRKP